MKPKSIVLVDAMNVVHRVHHTHGTLMTSKGRPTGIIHGFIKNVLYMKEAYPRSLFVFCWDGPKIWRRSHSPIYKANRVRENTPEAKKIRAAFVSQNKIVREILGLVNLLQFRIRTLEADDLIAILSYAVSKPVIVYSGDKDYYQLISDRVNVVTATKKGLKEIGVSDVEKEYSIGPDLWTRMRALCGDASDNIKPVKGIGPKKAVGLIQAGIDPSLSNFELHPMGVRKQHRFLAPYWSAIRDCYILSELPRSENFKYFKGPERVKIKWSIKQVKDRIKKGNERTDEEQEQAEKVLAKLLLDYELAYLHSRRGELFRML